MKSIFVFLDDVGKVRGGLANGFKEFKFCV